MVGRSPKTRRGGGGGAVQAPHLEVEDAGVAVLEALPVRHDAVEEALVEREGGDGRQQPAVTCGHPRRLGFGVKSAVFCSLNTSHVGFGFWFFFLTGCDSFETLEPGDDDNAAAASAQTDSAKPTAYSPV